MDKKSLIDIVNQAARIEQMLIENGGEITSEIQDLMTINSDLLPEKVESYNAIMERMEHLASYYSAKAEFFDKIKKTALNLSKSLKENMKHNMLRLGVDEMEGMDIKFKLSKSNPTLVVYDQKKIPDEFLIEERVIKINNSKLKDHLKSGGECSGANLEDSYSLRVYPKK